MPNKKSNIHTSLCPELHFLIACCRVEPDLEEIGKQLQAITNHQSLIATSMRHGVLPLVYKTLKNFNEQNHKLLITNHQSLITNHHFLSELKSHYMSIVQRNMLMTAELTRIMQRLKEHNIDALAFKGPALAQIAYGDITLRNFSDLDVLIHRRDFRRAAELMLYDGFKPRYPIETFTGDKAMFEMNNDCPFYDQKRRISIEIHWDFFRKLALPTARFQPWYETENVTINGMEVRTLRKETHLLYHSLHGSKHIWERLCWVVDIDRFIRNVPGLNWDLIIDQARKLGALRMFLLGPALAKHFFSTPLPSQVEELCEQEDFSELIRFIIGEYEREDPAPEDSLVKLSKVIDLRDNLYYKTLTLLEFLFRPGINERRSMVLSDRWFWLYWPLRPLGMGYRFLFCRKLKLCSPAENS